MNDLMKKMEGYTDKIEAQTRKRSRLQGRLEAALEDLKREGFDSEEEAQKFVEEQTVNLEKLEATLKEDMEEFEDAYAQYLE